MLIGLGNAFIVYTLYTLLRGFFTAFEQNSKSTDRTQLLDTSALRSSGASEAGSGLHLQSVYGRNLMSSLSAVVLLSGEDQQQLIPGLPNHIAVLCLIKVPRLYHVNFSAVSRSWRQLMRNGYFYQCRRENDITDPWLVILSTDHLGSPKLHYFAYDLPSRQLLFKALLPPFSISVETQGADDYKLVAMNEYFVVLNWQKDGVWSEELPFLIYNILTNSWKKGACVSVRRHSFSCGVINGKLYITGGLNLEGRFEHSTECYDFLKDEWRFVASLPKDVPPYMEDDAVFQGKLYLRCCHVHSGKVYWVYDPVADEWRQEPCLSKSSCGNEGQLFATNKSLYSLTRENAFYRFMGKEGAWKLVGKIGGDSSSVMQDSSLHTDHTEASNNGLSKEARRVFAFGNDIFVLAAGKPGWHCTLLDEDGSKCHRLFLGNSSYRAGAVVQA
eukprot:c29965_g1_i1 orf=20-1348(+)